MPYEEDRSPYACAWGCIIMAAYAILFMIGGVAYLIMH